MRSKTRPDVKLSHMLGTLLQSVSSRVKYFGADAETLADRASRVQVYEWLAPEVARRLDLEPEELLPHLTALLEADVTEELHPVVHALQDILVHVDVVYRQRRTPRPLPDDTTTSRAVSPLSAIDADTQDRYILECTVITADGRGVQRTCLTHELSWDRLPAMARDHFIRLAEVVEFQMYPNPTRAPT